MSFIPTAQSINPPDIAASRAFVVFDRTTGEVVHIHHSVEFAHAVTPREPAEVRAQRLAGDKPGVTTDILEVDPEQVNHGKPIRIDVAKRAVVVIDRSR